MYYKNKLKSFRFPKPTQPRHLNLKLTFSKRPSLLPLTPSTATRPSSSCQQPAPQDSNPQRPTARPSSWWQQWTAPMDNKYSQTSRRTPGAVGRRQPRFTSSQIWQKKEAENPVQRIYSQPKTTIRGLHFKTLPVANFRRLMTRGLIKERSQRM